MLQPHLFIGDHGRHKLNERNIRLFVLAEAQNRDYSGYKRNIKGLPGSRRDPHPHQGTDWACKKTEDYRDHGLTNRNEIESKNYTCADTHCEAAVDTKKEGKKERGAYLTKNHEGDNRYDTEYHYQKKLLPAGKVLPVKKPFKSGIFGNKIEQYDKERKSVKIFYDIRNNRKFHYHEPHISSSFSMNRQSFPLPLHHDPVYKKGM
jgi:hypothetical protein